MTCLAGPAMGADNTFDGIYTGKRILTRGTAPPCAYDEDVSVTISGGTLTFTNSELRNFVIVFHPQPDGAFDQIYDGGNGSGAAIRGRIIDNSLDADVTNGTCKHHWDLTKEN